MSTTELDRALHTTVLKREESKEKAFRDERARREEEFQNEFRLGGSEMTAKELRKIIDSDKRCYYRTEELNDKLYIHYKGWRELQNLEGWTGLKTLYAECNAFSEITGLQTCTKIRSLFLQENCIKRISGLETLTDLWSINLSSNFIERIEGLSACTKLNTLIIAKNKIGFGGIADIEQLADSSVCSLDLQDNRLEDPDVLPEVFARMKDLRVLYLKGNPAAKKIVNYRKSLTAYCKDMRYIDDRPVFEDDRRCAEAFNRGGIEEERAEKRRIKEEKSQAHDRNMRLFQEMIENSRREKKERDAMRTEDKYTDDTDPVESSERRQKRLLDAWKENNKDDLKDDAKEYAERCLKAEREGKAKQEAQQENVDQDASDTTQKAAADRADAAGTDTGADTAAEKKKEDNRKLVYEDIWDDVPQSSAATQPAQPSGPAKSLQPAGGTDGVFLPWAEGAVGMDAVSPPSNVMAQRKAALSAGGAEKSASSSTTAGDADGGGASWHQRYQEKVAETQVKLAQARSEKQSTIFAPPDRTAQPSPAVPKNAESGTATATADPAVGPGELDEMD